MRAERPRLLTDELREFFLVEVRRAAFYPLRPDQLTGSKQGSSVALEHPFPIEQQLLAFSP